MLASVAEQASMGLTWLETPEDSFLVTRLIFISFISYLYSELQQNCSLAKDYGHIFVHFNFRCNQIKKMDIRAPFSELFKTISPQIQLKNWPIGLA